MLKTDSRKIEKGDTFLALRGVETDGHNFILSAIENGASKIICEEGSYDVPTIIVDDTRAYLAKYLKDKYEDKLKNIKLVGITGTNGKTTSAYLTYQILNKLGVKTAYIGTIGFYLDTFIKKLNNTTPDLMELYELFDICIKESVSVIVMEVSSHALEIGRLKDVLFDIVAFTNLTQDHLDVHGTMENYLYAKLKLFNKLKKDGYAIVNVDDDYSKYFILEKNNNITYGKKQSDYQFSNCKFMFKGSKFDIKIKDKEYVVSIDIPCEYNIYNYVLSLAICNKLGLLIENVLSVKVEEVEGRFKVFEYNNNNIVIDYAHTPDAMEKLLNHCNNIEHNKIIAVFGCMGNRDKLKRPIMGDIATKLSSYVIFTDHNPGIENSIDIVKDTLNGVEKDNYEIILDRKEAIRKGISLLTEKDILLILGKGYENYQIIGKEKVYYSDKESVEEIIKEKSYL